MEIHRKVAVEHGADVAGTFTCEPNHDELGPVVGEHGDPVAGANAHASERIGECVRFGIEFREGERSCLIAHCDSIGKAFCGVDGRSSGAYEHSILPLSGVLR